MSAWFNWCCCGGTEGTEGTPGGGASGCGPLQDAYACNGRSHPAVYAVVVPDYGQPADGRHSEGTGEDLRTGSYVLAGTYSYLNNKYIDDYLCRYTFASGIGGSYGYRGFAPCLLHDDLEPFGLRDRLYGPCSWSRTVKGPESLRLATCGTRTSSVFFGGAFVSITSLAFTEPTCPEVYDLACEPGFPQFMLSDRGEFGNLFLSLAYYVRRFSNRDKDGNIVFAGPPGSVPWRMSANYEYLFPSADPVAGPITLTLVGDATDPFGLTLPASITATPAAIGAIDVC